MYAFNLRISFLNLYTCFILNFSMKLGDILIFEIEGTINKANGSFKYF